MKRNCLARSHCSFSNSFGIFGQAEEEKKQAEEIYQNLLATGKEVLFDDREGFSAGQKFADSDLIGIPTRYVVSQKTLAEKSVEVKDRKSGDTRMIKIKDIK
jgi:prolyl-tRNA synthetase